jgi:DNA-binding phage protein
VDAIQHAGAEARPIRIGQLRLLSRLDVYCHALVWDCELHGGGSVQLLNKLRETHPFIPVLAYIPNRPDCERKAARMWGIAGVSTKLQFTDPAEGPRLRTAIIGLVNDIPAVRIGRVMHLLLGDVSATTARFLTVSMTVVCRQVLARLPQVGDVARRCGVTVRTLERTLHTDGLPPPRRTLDSLFLLSITERAAETGERTATEARRVGIKRNGLYRLRNRVLPARARPFEISAQQEFDLVLLSFAQRCGISKKHARSVLAQFALWRGTRLSTG